MTISAFDLFKIGIWPSSSHTVGPMRAAAMFARSLRDEGLLDEVRGIRAELFGSLGATGHGHGSVKAVVLGLSGEQPDTVDPVAASPMVAGVRESGRLRLLGLREIAFDPDEDVILHRRKRLPFHPNAMRFAAFGGPAERDDRKISERTYHSVGGLVQIPCIERNAIASVKAITAARMAVRGDGEHHVSLDKAIKTMRETGADMKDKYKETARGGLALNVVEC